MSGDDTSREFGGDGACGRCAVVSQACRRAHKRADVRAWTEFCGEMAHFCVIAWRMSPRKRQNVAHQATRALRTMMQKHSIAKCRLRSDTGDVAKMHHLCATNPLHFPRNQSPFVTPCFCARERVWRWSCARGMNTCRKRAKRAHFAPSTCVAMDLSTR